MKRITISVTTIILLFTALGLQAQDGPLYPSDISEGKYWGLTPAIRDLPPLTADELDAIAREEAAKRRNRSLQTREFPFASSALPKGPDPVWQQEMGKTGGSRAPLLNVAGQNSGSYPPDCNGAVGPNHYMQTVNVTYAIYDKSGTLVSGPFNMNTLFGSVPGANCNSGDPIILYDEVEDRWLAVEFSLCNPNDLMLVAVSQTSDPTGSWHQYSFDVDDMPDYEKMGIWSDGYYMGTNTPGGNDIYVLEKAQMMVGGTAQMVAFDNAWRPTTIDGFHCVPPLDNDGTNAPAGTPGLWITLNDDAIGGGSDELWIYELDVDWVTPSNSTFNRVQQLAVASFDSNFGNNWDNIAQLGTNQELDAIPMVIMNRPQYRNFGTYETIVCNHTVDVDGTDHAGIRWYELRRTGGGLWTVRQQGTYAPDSHSRWMGSVVLNGTGQIGMGYSISSSAINPGIRYTGQTLAEYNSASGIMDLAEEVIWTGSYSQTGINRWGDYANISIDPNNDFTFWFSTEYMGSSTHGTRIAAFEVGVPSLTAQFTGTPQDVCPGGTVNFTDQSLGGPPTSWNWNFPGGTPATSTLQNPVVTYATAGTYDVTLIVSDGTVTDTLTRTGYIAVAGLNADFSGTPVVVVAGNSVNFTDLTTCSPTSWSWTFPGGTPAASTLQDPVVAYSTPGSYDVTLEATGSSGTDTETKTAYIHVVNCIYCASTFADPDDDWIANVTFNTINNSSGAGAPDKYEDFTGISTTVEHSNSYPITVTLDMLGNWTQHVFAFIDWNQDCDFADAGESYDLGQRTGPGTVSGSISVPSTAAGGATRMRIVEMYNSNPGPCDPHASQYGETEDYTVVVLDAGTPGLWTGSVSTDWNTAGNWDNGSIPLSGTSVTIPASVPSGNLPVRTGDLVTGTHCGDLLVQGSSTLSISGAFTLSPGNTLAFGADGTLRVGGDLSVGGTLIPGIGTIELYSTSTGNLSGNPAGGALSDVMTLSTFGAGMSPLTAWTEGPTGDDGATDIPLPFAFQYNGVDYANVRMSTNGWLSFSPGGSTSYTNSNLFSTTNPNATLAPWWDDLEDDATSSCRYATDGTAPNRVFIAEWNGVLSYHVAASTRLNFQVKLFESTNVVEFHYGTVNNGSHHNSESASIGIEDETGGTNHFIEATTGSSTAGVTDLVSDTDWPTVNYRFTPASPVILLNDLLVDKSGGSVNALTDLELSGRMEIRSGSTLVLDPGISVLVNGTAVLMRNSDGVITVIREEE